MPGLDGAAILSVWERGSVQQLGKRALTLLQLAGISSAEACALPAGTRDATLLRIRLRLFGDRIEGVASCDACGEELDLTLSVAQLLGGMPFAETTLRVPNAGDLAAIASAGDDETGVTLLLERLRPDIEPAPEARAEYENALSAADPGAEVRLVSACPSCNARSEALFDAPSFLWKELQALARDMLSDVHTLARVYGWDEPTILALTPARRRFYLDAIER
jgi:hypothetical protein